MAATATTPAAAHSGQKGPTVAYNAHGIPMTPLVNAEAKYFLARHLYETSTTPEGRAAALAAVVDARFAR